jgi:mannosidase alpha-like ER degradation enhancer 1
MHTGQPTYHQFNSLSAFWPGLQVLVGDVALAKFTHHNHFNLWKKYGMLPERYWLQSDQIHDSERYYPLRPEVCN